MSASSNPYLARGLQRLKGETHLHTVHSDGADTPADMLAACCQAGYQFAAITDHNTVSSHAEAHAAAHALGLPLLLGAELTTFRGHALCLGVDRMPEWRRLEEQGMDAFAAEVHALGGLFCVCHPIRMGAPVCSGCAWEWPIQPRSVDLWEIFSAPNPRYPHPELSLWYWQRQLAQGGRAAPVAAGDVHSVAAASADRAATYVYVAEPTADAVLAGLRSSRLVASAGERLDCWLEASDGDCRLMGEEARAGAGWVPRLDGDAALRQRVLGVVRGTADLVELAVGEPLPEMPLACVYAEGRSAEDGSLRAVTAPIWMV